MYHYQYVCRLVCHKVCVSAVSVNGNFFFFRKCQTLNFQTLQNEGCAIKNKKAMSRVKSAVFFMFFLPGSQAQHR